MRVRMTDFRCNKTWMPGKVVVKTGSVSARIHLDDTKSIVRVRESEAAADRVASEVPDDNFQPTVATSEPDAPLPNTSS